MDRFLFGGGVSEQPFLASVGLGGGTFNWLIKFRTVVVDSKPFLFLNNNNTHTHTHGTYTETRVDIDLSIEVCSRCY